MIKRMNERCILRDGGRGHCLSDTVLAQHTADQREGEAERVEKERD
jgi:hypothetical protein